MASKTEVIVIKISPELALRMDDYREEMSRSTFVEDMVKRQIRILESNRKFQKELRRERELRKAHEQIS